MKKILAIDDQVDNLLTIQAVIKNRIPECEILTALSGQDGIDIAIKEQPDTILLDIIMPKMDGFETCKKLKENELTKHIPVIMVTAIKTDSANRVKGLNTGADAFISKPIDAIELTAQVSVMLRIKEAEDKLRKEKYLLEDLVLERTKDLRESEENYHSIFDGTKDGILHLSKKIRVLNVNRAFTEITGIAAELVVGKSGLSLIKKFFKNKQLPKALSIANKMLRGEQTDDFVLNYQDKVFELSIKQLENQRFVVILRDITKRKQIELVQKVIYNISSAASSSISLEQLIAFSQKELGKIIDTTNFYLALYDDITDTISLPFFADEYDSYKTLPAKKTITRYVIQSKKSLLAKLETIIKLEKAGEIERYGSDSLIWLGVPLKIDDKVIGVIAVQSYTDENAYNESDKKMLEFISDQTSMTIHRKKAEEDIIAALQKAEESEVKFRELFEKSGDAVLILKNRKFVDCNQAAVDMLQYNDKEEFLNLSPSQLSPATQYDGKKSDEKSDEMIEMAIKNGTYRFEWEHNRSNGVPFPAEVLLTAISKDESEEIIHVTWRDITNRKKAEKDIIAALQKAEESDRLKSAFLANMSHEIRTPMNGIMGFAQLLKEPSLEGDEQMKFIDIIVNSGNRMLNIINDLIDISKIEAGQTDIIISEINLNDQTEYLHTFFKPEAEKAGLQLSFKNTLSNALAVIESDREKIFAILTNLIKNAIKYTKKGSIEFGYNLRKNKGIEELEFYVEDTGIGIAKDKLDAIFERFVQADLSLASGYEGAGLGLAITKGYIELLGGRIWVDSKVGRGSKFYFTIPYRAKSTQKHKKKDVESINVSDLNKEKFNILVVEDDKISEFYLKTLTKDISKEFLEARTGIEAVEICKKKPDIELIFMDIKMPEMDGYTATRKIREFNKDVKIIAQTAYALEGDRRKALDAGCNDYISKPTPKDKLLETIWKHMRK